MSTLKTRFRTNYFRVRDDAAFKKLIDAAGFSERSEYATLWSTTDELGRAAYAFGSASLPSSEAIDAYFKVILAHPNFPRIDHKYGGRATMTFFSVADFLKDHGLREPDPADTFPDFCRELQKVVAPDDAVVIVEAGYEKLRYVGADATIITPKAVVPVTFSDYIARCLRALVDKNYETRLEG